MRVVFPGSRLLSLIDFLRISDTGLRFLVLVYFLLVPARRNLFSAQESPSPPLAEARPAVKIELSRFGYDVPSRIDRLTEDEPSVALNFMDARHLLITFDRKSLFQRLHTCPPDHRDRLMHAVIIDVGTGSAVKQTDWYLHDRRRYLWPFGSGKVLLRRLNDLYVVDSDLNEKLLMSSPQDLLWVAVTPDGSQLTVETATDPNPSTGTSFKTSADSVKPKFVARVLDTATLNLQQTIPLNQVINLVGTRWGYADLVHKGDVWLVRFGPSPTQRRNITRVRSRTVPNIISQMRSGEVTLHTEVDVPAGAVSLRLGIQDEMSTHIGTVEIALPVRVPPNASHRRIDALPEIEPD